MPPKRKAASTKKSVVNASSEIPIDHDEFTNEETVEQSSSKQQQTQEQPETGSTSTNTAESMDQSEEEPTTSGSSLKDKMAKLKELKRRRVCTSSNKELNQVKQHTKHVLGNRSRTRKSS